MKVPEHLLKKLVLLVDDEEVLVEINKEFLEAHGIKCTTAFSGNQAIEVIQSQPVDIIVSDIRMKDGTGVDLLRNCRDGNAKLPAVVLNSGFSDYSDEELMAMGANAYLEKPISLPKLLETLVKTSESLEAANSPA